MYTKPMVNAKKILIESETIETFTLKIRGLRTVRLFCPECDATQEMVDLNSAADVSGASARELLRRVESGELHSPETSSGHFMICRGSLEHAINSDRRLQPSSSATSSAAESVDSNQLRTRR